MDFTILYQVCVGMTLSAITHVVNKPPHQFFVFVAPGNIGTLKTGIYYCTLISKFPFTDSICVSIADLALLWKTDNWSIIRLFVSTQLLVSILYAL